MLFPCFWATAASGPSFSPSTLSCANLLPLPPTEQGLLALVRASIQDGLRSSADLGPWFAKLQRGEVQNPLAHLADTVESRIYKDGFDLMISQMGQSEFSIERLVPAVDRLLKSAQASAVTEDTLSDATIDAVFGPNELLRFKIPDSEFASPPQVTRSDSGQDVIVTATQSEIALSQPGEFGSNGIIKAPQNEPSVLSLASLSLKHFISFAGDPFIAVGDTRNFKTTLYSATNGDAQPVIFPVSKPWALLRLE